MDLVVDLGNTNQKAAVLDQGVLVEINLYDRLGAENLKQMVDRLGPIRRAVLSAVVEVPSALEDYLSSIPHFILLNETTPLPFQNNYLSKNTLGKDRLAAVAGGQAMFPGNDILVVNAGTCITFDFLEKGSVYQGGAISPGLKMRLKALNTFTGKLPLVDLEDHAGLIGRDTPGSILSGVLNGAIAEIEGIADRYAAKHPGLKVILSGGDLNYFDKRLKISTFAAPNIVIHGLQKILAFNVA